MRILEVDNLNEILNAIDLSTKHILNQFPHSEIIKLDLFIIADIHSFIIIKNKYSENYDYKGKIYDISELPKILQPHLENVRENKKLIEKLQENVQKYKEMLKDTMDRVREINKI